MGRTPCGPNNVECLTVAHWFGTRAEICTFPHLKVKSMFNITLRVDPARHRHLVPRRHWSYSSVRYRPFRCLLGCPSPPNLSMMPSNELRSYLFRLFPDQRSSFSPCRQSGSTKIQLQMSRTVLKVVGDFPDPCTWFKQDVYSRGRFLWLEMPQVDRWKSSWKQVLVHHNLPIFKKRRWTVFEN